jgi:type 1 glutamine amidotransferase
MKAMFVWNLVAALSLCAGTLVAAPSPWVVYDGFPGPGKGKHIVLVSGDEEYRSEEALTQLGRILARHHGFKCTVLYAIDPATGEINPNVNNNIPGLEALKTADLMIIFTRWRNLPDEQMKPIIDYVEAGRPVLGIRTATHAFKLSNKNSPYFKYSDGYGGADYEGGFGRQVLGEKWIAHHGNHGTEATRGILAPGEANHPILRGIKDGEIFGPTDVYRVRLPLPGDSRPLVLGQVVKGMKPEDPPVEGEKNNPMMPIAWTKTYKGGRVFTSTMGSAVDMQNEAFRRLLVNGAYWCLGMEAHLFWLRQACQGHQAGDAGGNQVRRARSVYGLTAALGAIP